MDRTAALQAIRNARQTRGISYDDLAKAIGTKDATYLAAALHGQHRLNAEEAKSSPRRSASTPRPRWSPRPCRCARSFR